jgi:DNA repair ATPase RecN
MKDWKEGKGTSGAVQKRKLVTRAEMEEALAHIEKSNSEMGSVDMRLGRMEGRLEEALPQLQRSMDALFAKLDKLPCTEENTRLTRIETRLKDMRKTRFMILTVAASAIGSIIVYLVTHPG